MLWLEVMVMLPRIYNLYLKEEKRSEEKRRECVSLTVIRSNPFNLMCLFYVQQMYS